MLNVHNADVTVVSLVVAYQAAELKRSNQICYEYNEGVAEFGSSKADKSWLRYSSRRNLYVVDCGTKVCRTKQFATFSAARGVGKRRFYRFAHSALSIESYSFCDLRYYYLSTVICGISL